MIIQTAIVEPILTAGNVLRNRKRWQRQLKRTSRGDCVAFPEQDTYYNNRESKNQIVTMGGYVLDKRDMMVQESMELHTTQQEKERKINTGWNELGEMLQDRDL